MGLGRGLRGAWVDSRVAGRGVPEVRAAAGVGRAVELEGRAVDWGREV